MSDIKIVQGDALEKLKDLSDNSVDLVCTDPPYGYSFMGKDWDKGLPDPEIFKECLRVLKPGAFAFVMSAPRSDVCSRMMIMLEGAGFRIDFTPLYWTYASGFPKAMNIGKMVDKRFGAEREVLSTRKLQGTARNIKGGNFGAFEGVETDTFYITAPATPQAKALDGSYGGFQPKPAVEVIIVAMKPLSEKTYVDQALKNGKGITWLDNARIPTDAPLTRINNSVNSFGVHNQGLMGRDGARFPANLLVEDDVLNDGRITKSPKTYVRGAAGFSTGNSGINTIGEDAGKESQNFGDSGSFSSYFSLDAWAKTLPFLITPKAAKSEGLLKEFYCARIESCKDVNMEQVVSLGRAILDLVATSLSIEGFGGNILGIYPKESISIIRTAIKKITELKTWNLLMQQPTSDFIRDVFGKEMDGGSRVESAQKSSEWTKKIGILQDKVGSVTTDVKNATLESLLKIREENAYSWHPTKKPLKLMSYLITLGSRPGDLVVDPFVGSGTTGLAAKELGRDFIGFEREKEYVEIAQARINSVASKLL